MTPKRTRKASPRRAQEREGFSNGPRGLRKRLRYGKQRINWLDFLPEDICVRLAAHVRARVDISIPENISLLNLAMTSEKQAKAVLDVIDRKFDLTGFKHDRYARVSPAVRDWERVMYRSMRELHIHISSVKTISSDLRLLSAPNLQHASIPNDQEFFHALQKAPRLRSLRVFLHRPILTVRLFESLASLRLEKLALHCCYRENCAFRRIALSTAGLKKFVQKCSMLRALELECRYHFSIDVNPVISAFSGVQELTTSGIGMNRSVSVLRQIESVKLSGRKEIFPTAVDVGVTLKALYIIRISGEDPRLLSREEIEMLQCPNLNELGVGLEEGAELAIQSKWEKLHKLRLNWHQDEHLEPWANAKSTYMPSADCIGNIVSHNVLTEIALEGIASCAELISTILKCAGERLRRFSVRYVSRDEPPHETLLALLDGIRIHTPSVRVVDYCDDSKYNNSELDLNMWRQKLTRSLRLTKRRSPQLNLWAMSRRAYESTTCGDPYKDTNQPLEMHGLPDFPLV